MSCDSEMPFKSRANFDLFFAVGGTHSTRVPDPDPSAPSQQIGQQAAPNAADHQPNRSEIILYAVISLVCFLVGLGVLSLLLWKAETLVKYGLVGNIYYVVLLPLGLCAAGFLFGVLRSYARYTGQQLGGTL